MKDLHRGPNFEKVTAFAPVPAHLYHNEETLHIVKVIARCSDEELKRAVEGLQGQEHIAQILVQNIGAVGQGRAPVIVHWRSPRFVMAMTTLDGLLSKGEELQEQISENLRNIGQPHEARLQYAVNYLLDQGVKIQDEVNDAVCEAELLLEKSREYQRQQLELQVVKQCQDNLLHVQGCIAQSELEENSEDEEQELDFSGLHEAIRTTDRVLTLMHDRYGSDLERLGTQQH
ncbi:hypothetical protein CC79DRAFT_1328185 [Sarocladium strictum]